MSLKLNTCLCSCFQEGPFLSGHSCPSFPGLPRGEKPPPFRARGPQASCWLPGSLSLHPTLGDKW